MSGILNATFPCKFPTADLKAVSEINNQASVILTGMTGVQRRVSKPWVSAKAELISSRRFSTDSLSASRWMNKMSDGKYSFVTEIRSDNPLGGRGNS
jgi:hypothetical protein